jgi:hypothetical protein
VRTYGDLDFKALFRLAVGRAHDLISVNDLSSTTKVIKLPLTPALLTRICNLISLLSHPHACQYPSLTLLFGMEHKLKKHLHPLLNALKIHQVHFQIIHFSSRLAFLQVSDRFFGFLS